MIETIVAPVTAPGHAGVSVVRVSGPLTRTLLESFALQGRKAASRPREMVFTGIRIGGQDAQILHDAALAGEILDGEILDQGMVVWFPAPGSFTGEDCAEFHLHGSPYIVNTLIKGLCVAGARLAKPGEFTERAFHNGKIDLCQAEAVADLIAAETELQARAAREQLEGRLSGAIAELGEPLRNFLAEMEAYIDFPEEDISPLTTDKWQAALSEINTTLSDYLASYSAGKLCRDGALVVLAGLPNAGKSSLLNALLGEERAIVTDIPGTTRDSIEERISLDGLCLRLCDTAGLLSEEASRTPDPVEQLGIARSWEQLSKADLVLFLTDGRTPLTEAERPLFERIIGRGREVMVLVTKGDLLSEQQKSEALERIKSLLSQEALVISSKTAQSEGVLGFKKALRQRLLGGQGIEGRLLITTQRHAEALREARNAVNEGIRAISDRVPPEFVAVHVRAALGALNEIIGVTHTEDILGRIFSKFCIGK